MTSRRSRAQGPPRDRESEDRDPIRAVDLRQLRRLAAFVRPYRARLAVAVVAVVVASAMGLVFPLVVGDLVDSALVDSVAGDPSALNRIALLLLVVFAVQAVFNYVQQYQLAAVGEGVVADLRTRLYSHLMLLSVKFFELRKTGEITSRLTSDVAVVRGTVSHSVAQLASQTLTLLGGVVMLFVISARLSAAVLVVVPLLIVAARFFGRRLERLSTAFQDRVAEANAVAEEAIAGIRVVQWFGAERVLVDRYSGSVASSYRLALRRARLRALFIPAVQFAVFASVALVLWFGGRLVLAGQMTGGDLVTFLLYTFTVAGAIGTFSGLYSQLQEALGSTRRIFEMLDEVSDLPEPDQPIPLGAVEGRVAFDDVSFGYSDRAGEVLNGITLEAAAGDVTALVGPSGAGKSTLVQLIARFYDPCSGRICIDGVDITQVSLTELRSHMAAVPQDTHLFLGDHRRESEDGEAGRGRRGATGSGDRRQRPRLHRRLSRRLRHPGR